MKKYIYFIPLLTVSMLASCGGGNNPNPPTPPENTFNVTWDLSNGTNPIVEQYKEGEIPFCKADHAYKFVDDLRIVYFTDWDKPLSPVTEDITYTALYDEDNPLKVATVVSLIGLLPENETFKFGYSGKLSQVEWGDGKIDSITDNNDNFCEHTYEFPDDKPISVKIVIYGKLDSFWLSDESGKLLGKANLAAKSVVLAETIKNVPDYGLAGLKCLSAVMLDDSLDYVGKYALKDIGSSCIIYLQNGLNTNVLQPNWNPKQCHVVDNVTKLSLEQGTDNNFYGGVQAIRNEQQYFVFTDFYPYDYETKEKTSVTIPDEINGNVIDAIKFSPFFYSGYEFNEIRLPNKLSYILENGLEKTVADKIVIPVSVKEICDYAFNYFKGDIEISDVGDSQLYYIGANAFRSCQEITKFDVPSKLKYLDSNAFAYCEKLSTINNFENCQVEVLKEGAFRNCAFNDIKLPQTLKNLQSYCFYNINGLTIDASNFNGSSIPTCAKYAFNTTITVKYNSELGTPDSARQLFVAKGWPNNATYEPLQ